MSKENIAFGARSEEAAAEYLKNSGYDIVERNVRTRFGEIDIIAREKNTLCFVEVKSRGDDSFGSPKEALNYPKRAHLSKAALAYLKEKRLFDISARFDVVSIEYKEGKAQIELLKNAFELEARYSY